jgi:molecular chaperone DnaK (HSP70)
MLMEQNLNSRDQAPFLGVDFGDGSIVCATAMPDGGGYHVLAFPGWSQEISGSEGPASVHRIPALIHYPDKEDPHIGCEVLVAGFDDSPATGRWIRRYLLEESTAQIFPGEDRCIPFREAASDLLTTILARAAKDHPGLNSVVFSVPHGAPGWYPGWLSTLARSAGLATCHTLDECAAAAAGYGLLSEGGRSFLVFSFDETSLGFTVVRWRGPGETGEMDVIGSARADTGLQVLGRWIAQELIAKSRIRYHGAQARNLQESARSCVERVLTQLACAHEAEAGFPDPVSGRTASVSVTADDITRILDENGLPRTLDEMLRRALGTARAKGYDDLSPSAVLMIGRGSAIKAIQELVCQRFPGVNILHNHPFDAIAQGAALYRPRNPGSDRIRNDYALRYWDPAAREHRYRFLVRGGARFPSAGQVARITISAAYDGQARLGIPLYEIRTGQERIAPALELVRDPAGGVRLAGPDDDTGEGKNPVPINGSSPTLLAADPPAVKGEPRFELTFTIDRERQLCLTARDLITGFLVRRETPVCRLT